MTTSETESLLHELCIHQNELKNSRLDLNNARSDLLAAKAYYHDLFELAPVGYFILNSNALIQEINLTAVNMLGLLKSSLKMKPFYCWIHPEDKDSFFLLQEQLAQTGLPQALDLRMLRKDQSILWVRLNACVDSSKEDKFLTYRMAISDIQTNRNLLNQQNVLNQARLKADSENRAKSDFISCMSHEMRTPLGIILGYVELLCNNSNDKLDLKQTAEILRRNSQHLLGLINDVLDLSKIDSGMLDVNCSSIELASFLTSLKEAFQQQIAAKGLKLNIKANGKIPARFHSDEFRLRQILINIVGNAIKFTASGSIDIAVSISYDQSPEGELVFIISDSGCGIAEKDQNLIFEPFAQGDRSVERSYGGTGLGLFLARKMARALGGDVILKKSDQHFGSTFEIRINPGRLEAAIWISIEDMASLPSQQGTVQAQQETRLQDLRILVIDDFEDNRILIRLILAQEGIHVELASGAAEGLEKTLSSFYNIILLDIQMPEMSGYEVASILRNKGYTRPIIALTAHAMKGERERCISAGCNDYLAKPIVQEELIRTIIKYLPKKQDRAIISTIPKDNPVHKLVPRYVEKLSAYVEEIQQHISQRNWSSLEKLAHQFSGTCGSYGFSIMTPLYRELEQLAREESADSQKLTSISSELNSLIKRITPEFLN